MAIQNNIQVYLNDEEEKLIEKAGKLVSLNKSSFCRSASIKESKKIIKENNLEVTQ